MFLTITHVGRVSLIFTRGVSSSHRTTPNIGWPVQTGSTIQFDNKSHNYPSPDIITNPSTDRIHHYLYNIVHICGNIKKQFTIPAIPNNTLTNSTALIEHPRQTNKSSPRLTYAPYIGDTHTGEGYLGNLPNSSMVGHDRPRSTCHSSRMPPPPIFGQPRLDRYCPIVTNTGEGRGVLTFKF